MNNLLYNLVHRIQIQQNYLYNNKTVCVYDKGFFYNKRFNPWVAFYASTTERYYLEKVNMLDFLKNAILLNK